MVDSPIRLLLFGPPGAGKGTQAKLLTEQLKVLQISSGDLFRYNLEQGTPLGKRAAAYMNQGLLVPDEITIDLFLNKILGIPSHEGFLLDGFPRTIEQANALEGALADGSRQLDKVVFINVPEDELIRRLGSRFTCRDCQTPHTVTDSEAGVTCNNCGGELYQRDDDGPESIKQRLQVYRSETLPLLDFYGRREMLLDIPGTGSIQCVNRRVLSGLGLSDVDAN